MPPRLAQVVTERRFRAARLWAFSLLAFVLGNDALYRVEYGPLASRALAVTGQGYWLWFAGAALLLAAAPVAGALAGLLRLQSDLRSGAVLSVPAGQLVSTARVVRVAPRGWLAEFRGVLPRVTAAVLLAFLVQEDAQYAAAGHAVPGLAVLGWPYHPLALPVLCAVSAAVSAAASWVRWRGRVLEARLRDVRARSARLLASALAAPRRWGIIAASVARDWLIGRRLAGRAPPVSAAA